jgi:hypothetical protein
VYILLPTRVLIRYARGAGSGVAPLPSAEELAKLAAPAPMDVRKEIETNFLRSLSKRPTLVDDDDDEDQLV